MGVLVSEDVLLDTVALWGLVFANSKYHGPVVEAVRGKRVLIHSICFLELTYPAYKLESCGGRNVREGLRLISDLMRSYSSIVENYRLVFGIEKLTIIPLTVKDILEAYRLILEEKEVFMEEREGYWPSIVDAVVASYWAKTKIKLLTNDRKLIMYGEKHGLPYTKIMK